MFLHVHETPVDGYRVLGSQNGLLTVGESSSVEYCHQGMATLESDPTQGSQFDRWWLIARGCNGLAAYYREMIAHRFDIRLLQPSFMSHISVISGERPKKNIQDWKAFDKKKMAFSYSHDVFTNGEFWWLRIHSPEMNDLREHFGLCRAGIKTANGFLNGKYPLHLTIGKTHPSDILR